VNRLFNDEADFLQSLSFDDLKESYAKEKAELMIKVEADIADCSPQKARELRDEIRTDREHRKILNACVYPFATKMSSVRKLGYYFLRAAPLLEKEIPNLDFLVYKPGSTTPGLAIFGEAKGTISDPPSEIKQTTDRVSVVMENAEYCKTSYLGGQSSSFEFVLGVSSIDSNNVAKAVARRGVELIVWHSERSANPQLTIHVPAEKEARESMMHSDDNLNRELGKKVPTSLEFKTFFLQSHKIAKLLVLIGIDKFSPDGTFTKGDLTNIVERELDYVDDPDTISRETETILTTAIKIGFVSPLGEDRYKIKSRYRNSASRETDLIDKWLEYRLGEIADNQRQDAVRKVREKYRRLRASRPDLAAFLK
jgi:hypothetical protein